MNNCNCNQGRLPCTCDKYGTVERPKGITLVAVVAILIIIMGLYALARHLIGVPLL